MGFVFDSFLQFYKAHPVMMSFNAILSLTFPIDDIIVPYLTGHIVTLVQEKKDFAKPLVTLIIILFVMQVFYAMSSWHDAVVFPAMQNFVRSSMLGNVLDMFKDAHRELNVGEIMSRFVKIPITVVDIFERYKNYLIPYFLSFITTSIFIMKVDLLLGVVIFVIAMLVFLIIILSPKRCITTTRKQEDALAKLDDETDDILRNMLTIFAADQHAQELERMKGFEKHYAKTFSDTMTCIVYTRIFAIMLLGGMLAFFGHRCYHGIKNKMIKPGSFVTIFFIIVQWFGTLGWLSGNIRDIVIDWAVMDGFEKIRRTENVTTRNPRSDESIHNAGDGVGSGLVLQNLSYHVTKRETPILSSLNLKLERGERVAIVGDIGSGKSTLLKVLLGVIQPSSGEIYIDGHRMSKMSHSERRKRIGYVAQHPILFNRSVWENITYGIKGVSLAQVKGMSQSLGLDNAFDNLGDGLESNVGKNGSRLSGGQRQMIACMRVMLMNPDIIALDEVTSSIDHKTKEKLFELLDVMFHGKIVIMVTHDTDLLQMATRVVHLDNGKFVHKATHSQL